MNAKTERKIREQASQQNWRKVWNVGNHSEIEKAHRLRRHLVDAYAYPTEGILDEPTSDSDYYEALCRAELPDILAELDRADLVAIYRAARLLAIVPRDREVFTHQARNSAIALASGGLDPRDFGLDPEGLGVGWVLDLSEMTVEEVEVAAV